MQNLANLISFLALFITLICFILLVYRLINVFAIGKSIETLKISHNDVDLKEQRMIKRLKYLKSPLHSSITNLDLYQNILILFNVLPFALINRILIFGSNYTFYILGNSNKTSTINVLEEIWRKWDTPHYLSIAKDWYQSQGDERLLIVFYPLYPIIIKIFNVVVNDYFLSGIIVSNIFLIIGLYYIYKLVLLEFDKEEIAFNTVKYILIFPLSFFFSIVYTESLFLCLCVMTLYFARKKRWLLSGFTGFLAALTRNQGILLIIPLFIEILYEYQYLKRQSKPVNKSNHSLTFLNPLISLISLISLRPIISLILIPSGTFIYLLINKLVSGDWLIFLTYQKQHWNQSAGLFNENIKNSLINVFTMNQVMAVNVWIPHIFLFFISFSLLIYAVNKIRLSYTVFSFFYIIMSYSPTWALSAPRYIMGMFTLFMMLAILIYEYKFLAKYLDLIFIFLLSFYTIQFSLSRVF